MTNFIKLQYADNLENYTDSVVFLGAITHDRIFTNDNICHINDLLEAYGRGTIEKNILPFFNSVGYSISALAELYNACVIGDDPEGFDTLEDYEDSNIANVKDAIAYDCGEFLSDMLYYVKHERTSSDDLTAAFIDFLGLQAFTVGYSPWSYAITFKEHDRAFYNDLWNGWNFYDLIEVDQHGAMIDIIGAYYIRTDQELRDAVKDCFGFDSFKLIDNEAAAGFDIEKAETITTYR